MSTPETGLEKVIEVEVDPRLSRGVKAFLRVLNSSGGPPLETLPPLAAREVLVNAQASVPVDLSGIEELEKTITTDGYTIKLNVVRPEGVKGRLPVFIFIHGGGWVLGDYPTHKRMVRDLVVLTGFAGVFVNYTRTPDARYPQAINEIYAATKWVTEHGNEIDVDGKNLAVVGNSVGGNMTAVTALVAESDILRDEGEAYGRKLDEAGVKVTTVRYDGMIHDFGLLNGLAEEPAVRSLFEHAAAELKQHLQLDGDKRTASA